MLGKLALIGAGAATMLAVGTMPAYAAYVNLNSFCAPPGDSGKACIHLSWDQPSGHIHARGAINPNCGHKITIEEVRLDEQVTQGGDTYPWAPVAKEEADLTSTCATVDRVAGPVAAQCDNGGGIQFHIAYRAVMHYRVFYDNGYSKGFAITTNGIDSPC